MKIVIAPDSFKGSLTARQAADAIERGVRRATPDVDIISIPMADGGEGTVRALVDATGGRLIPVRVTGPLGEPVAATYGILGDGTTAVIEMAEAAGLHLVGTMPDPLHATTRGVGELILDALGHGAERIIVGLGGSATNDGGAGMAQALGIRLLDADGRDLPVGGAALADLDRIDCTGLDPRVTRTPIILASDVTNPLAGPDGASAVFGPQKGATPAMVEQLDQALSHYAAVVRRGTGRSVGIIPGSGAAGGLGAGFLAFTDATMRSGVDLVTETVGLKERAVGADYCFTGEGRIDGQTQYGKTPMGVARAVHEAAPACHVIALAGSIGEDAEQLNALGFAAIFGIQPGAVSPQEALAGASRNLERTAEQVMRLLVS
ncbi:glycerate kinase [Bifidobacterium pullorum]|uniref:glycerate kinase n=1 Tax=Bifidobacterium pullorum TaxID=78448 RepID=UPI003AB7B010